MLVYSRWDYVDRDSDIAHHIWHCFPDGRDPRSYHGNYPKVRESRPWMELVNRTTVNLKGEIICNGKTDIKSKIKFLTPDNVVNFADGSKKGKP